MRCDGRAVLKANKNVSRETMERLDIYAALLNKWNPAINLVAKSTLAGMWTRHFLDSAQIFDLAPPSSKHWVDIGTGGGFPGMVVAILAAETRPNQQTTLVESDLRKATFLRTVARKTGVRVNVLSERIENVLGMGVDVLSARALAPLTQLLSHADQHLGKKGIALFLKGAHHREEMSEALKTWRFEVEEIQSTTDTQAVVLKIGGITRV